MNPSCKRLLQVWLACCAILMNALAPAVSHALGLERGQQHTWEICLNDGTRLAGFGELDEATFLVLTDRARPVPAKSMQEQMRGQGDETMSMADCGYCLPHAGALGLPPPASLTVPPAAAMPERPYLYYHAPRPLQAWAGARPRGPPAVS
ncbi:DUF2946 domain-containing protein [Massilia dura]|uniref:DUF2946 domain-containing protein n=1 Tax=Pseudoduganella dura TaxID=321982 RepID=A0A6I3X4K8_9BURK|nr:DUF2946 domain-containing protein [Pseudoduganella dura]MUI11799.1 DUF2946 domain-containing protein [Pseudoduganella dura]GGX79217.1 hypothetical protein GCM10007386_07780 [Pseudoduganella dura]